ncbi:TPA: fibrinogen-binding protein [Staphylococcus aureus]|nr:fibrinogen-binding protein [Staphylococcus aureus]HEG9834755.1 fibrinogen-binding protein [Staphylococcus aureus]HEH0524206.1 fibrinogen-binding protein [Staphylococcus aureus]HEH0540858.1 fibrinogen-binding protein [Staphylococcus aureus]HEH0583031.1 fibrinogen-binding protein [Staphylococcus aureus]
MKKNFIGKSILSIAAISLTVSTFAGESHAQTKNAETVKKYNEYQTNFKKQVNKKVVDAQKAKRTRTVATHRKAQRAVNLIHFQHSYEKKKLQRQIDLVLKYNTLK